MGLVNLSPEISLLIFHSLETLDDAYHLARCSKRLNQLYQHHRLFILQTIILRSPVYLLDAKLCLLIDATQAFLLHHHHNQDPGRDVWLAHQRCRPTVADLENIMETDLDHFTLSEPMVNDIVARWGGLRPLIKICFAFDGRWPTEPIGRNPMLGFMHSLPLAREPSSRWVARFYKAIIAVWFYQEQAQFGNLMHWECASTLSGFRNWSQTSFPVHTILDNADLLKAWNILFLHLLLPPFQLGSYPIKTAHADSNLRWRDFRSAVRPPDLSDLLILGTNPSAYFPKDYSCYFTRRLGNFRWAKISLSRLHPDDSPSETGTLLRNTIPLGDDPIREQLLIIFELAGVGRPSGPAYNRYLRSLDRLLMPFLQTWTRALESGEDIFAEWETSDQVVEGILGKPLLRELFRRDLDPTVPLSPSGGQDGHLFLAEVLRAHRRKEFHITSFYDINKVVMAEQNSKFTTAYPGQVWRNTYNRLKNEAEIPKGYS